MIHDGQGERRSINRRHAFRAPAAVFPHPQNVVETAQLSRDEKVVVLRNWKRTLEQLRHRREATAVGGFGRLDVDARLAAVTDALNILHGLR